MQETVLDYDRLVTEYQDALFRQLRGHRSLDYLEIWVPDEDHVKSLLNMVEAAQSCGRDRLVVDVGTATLSAIDTGRLMGLLAELGTATLEPLAAGMRLAVDRLNAPESPYRRALDARAAALVHTGELAGRPDATIVRVTVDGTTLAAAVDAEGVVVDAAHAGATGDLCPALDALCALMLARPLQEAAEHGVIRLESALRDRTLPAALPGICNPPAIDPIFALAQRLVRRLYDAYRAASGRPAVQNVFADAPSAVWLALSCENRRERVEAAIRGALVAAGFAADDARVLGIEQIERVMIAFRSAVPAREKARLALALEVALQSACDATLQIFLAEVKDDNAARRL